MTPRLGVWLAFLAALIAVAPVHWFGDSDGGGACAIMGFGLLVLLVIGTIVEVKTTKRREAIDRAEEIVCDEVDD